MDELGNYTERPAPFSSPRLRKSRAIRPTSAASTSPDVFDPYTRTTREWTGPAASPQDELRQRGVRAGEHNCSRRRRESRRDRAPVVVGVELHMHRDAGVCSIGYDELTAVFLLGQQRGHTLQPAPGLWNRRSSTATSSDVTRPPPSRRSRSTTWRVLAGTRRTLTAAWDDFHN